MESAPRSDAAPRSLGRYELLFRIASGGMAEVYAARVRGEAGFQKLLAVKRMLPQLADDEDFVTMFLDEARLAAHIESPHVVSTLDLGRADDGSLYLVMELVVGVTLARVLRQMVRAKTPVPVGHAVELLAQAAQGLHDAHEATTPVGAPLQLVHRDVSPQNILVGVDGRVRLTDFGVARAVLRITQTVGGQIKGKFAYCSPEQLRRQDVDRRSDLFSLGVVAWESFTGQRLFVGDHPAETIERVRTMPIPEVHLVRSDVPEEVSRVVMRALERDPDKRFEDAHAFAEALRGAARSDGVELPSRQELTRFVRKAGGETLQKIRDNIRQALDDTGDAVPLPAGIELVELTPSSASGVVERETSQPTDPTSTAQEPSYPEPDASAPGPGARNPSSLLPPAAEPEEPPTRVMEPRAGEPAAAAQAERSPGRKAGVVALGVVGAALLVAIGALAYTWASDDGPGGTAIPLEPRDLEAPVPGEGRAPEAVADPEPVDTATEADPEPVDELAADEPGSDPEGAQEAVRTVGRAGGARETRTSGEAERGATREEVRAAMLRGEPEPEAETPTATREEPVAERESEPTVTPMRTPRRESPTRMQAGSTTMGLVGVDAFDRDLQRRQ